MQEGVDASNIYFATPCTEKALVAELLISGDNIFICNGLDNEELRNMKFDVVVGNPPYQENGRIDNANKLWPRFVKLATQSMVAVNGVVSFIHPLSWVTPGADIGKGRSGFNIIRDVFASQQLIYANVCSDELKKKYFPDTGSTFSWYVVQNTKPYKKSMIYSSHGISEVDFSTTHSLPVILNNQSFSIMNKVKSTLPFEFEDQNHEVKSDMKNGKTDTTKEQSVEFCHKNYHTPANGGQYRYSNVKHSRSNESKVMISLSGRYTAVVDDGSIGYTGMSLVLFTPHTKTAEVVLNSRLYRFLVYNTKYSGFNPRRTILDLPRVDLSRSWTDKELYIHFKLTNEEIQLIEDTIK